MAVLRGGDDNDQHSRNSKAYSHVIKRRKSLFGSYADSDMLLWMKELAVSASNSGASRESIRQLWDQILEVRTVMFLTSTEFPQRKRKLQQFLKGKYRATSGLASEKLDQKKLTKFRRGQLSHTFPVSCLLNSTDSTESFNQQIVQNSQGSGSLLTSEDNLQDIRVATDFSFLDNAIELIPSNKDFSSLIDSDESVNGSNTLSPENLTPQNCPMLDFDESVHSSNTISLEEPKQLNLQTPRRSIRLLNFIGDSIPVKVVPLGPRFQADVPPWSSPANEGNLNGVHDDPANLRWLGTRIWPIEGRSVETTVKVIGKGRPHSCCCISPGSADCVESHILEERIILQSDLGPAFLSWKFDEMGEAVSRSWTLKEQNSFASFMKTYPLSNGKSFWKNALKNFPSKCKESIVSYYFNVFIPGRMGLLTRSSLNQVDSDGDEAEDVGHMDSPKKCKARRGNILRLKDLRTRYLCRPR